MLPPGDPRDRHAVAVGVVRVEGDAHVRHGHLLHRTEDVTGPAVEVAHGLLAGESPAGCVRRQGPVPVQDRQFDDLVGQHAGPDHAGDAVDVVAGGDPHVGAGSVDHRLVEPAEAADVDVTLQVAPELVAVVAQPSRVTIRSAGQQQSCALDRRRRDDHVARLERPLLAGALVDGPYARDPAGRVGGHLQDPGSRDQLAPGLDRRREQGVVGPVLGIAGARETDALAALHALPAPGSGHRVDQHRHRTRCQTELFGATPQHLSLGVVRQRRHGVRRGASALVTVRGSVPAHADLLLDPRVEGLQRVVLERPVGQRAALRHAVGGRQVEVFRRQPPGHALVEPGAAADNVGQGAVAGLPWGHDMLHLVRIDVDPDSAVVKIGRCVVAVAAEPVVAQVVVADVLVAQDLASIEHQHAQAGLGQDRRGDAAAGAGAHDDRVVGVGCVPKPPARQAERGWWPEQAGRAARARLVADHGPAGGVAGAVVALDR